MDEHVCGRLAGEKIVRCRDCVRNAPSRLGTGGACISGGRWARSGSAPKERKGKDMLTRNDAINEVLALYDEMDRMGDELNLYREREGEQLERIAARECGDDVPDPLTAKLCEFAKRAIIDKVLYGWKEVRAKRDESGEVVYSPNRFNSWLSTKVQLNELPSWMSYDEFLLVLDGELREMYALERKSALDRLLEKEAEKKEEEAEEEEGEADE